MWDNRNYLTHAFVYTESKMCLEVILKSVYVSDPL